MTNNLIDILPRFVLLGGTVMLPGEYDLEICGDTPIIVARQWRYLERDARIDRQSPFDDRAGKRIFENDTGLYLDIPIRISFKNGKWKVESRGCTMDLCGISSDVEITGMIPWEEKG